jgi:hypothetical protein
MVESSYRQKYTITREDLQGYFEIIPSKPHVVNELLEISGIQNNFL